MSRVHNHYDLSNSSFVIQKDLKLLAKASMVRVETRMPIMHAKHASMRRKPDNEYKLYRIDVCLW
jgi:hypothetical protein